MAMVTDTTQPQPHHASVEVHSLKLSLRDDLHFSIQTFGGETCYLIEDPVNSSFFRVGLSEYTFLSLLDGRRTIAEALAETAAIVGPNALSEQDVVAFAKWLIDSHLAVTGDSQRAERLTQAALNVTRHRTLAKLNPIFQKVPLFNPDRWIALVTPLLGRCFGRTAFIVWCCLLVIGCYCVWSKWTTLISGTQSTILDRSNWIWLAVCWMVLKLSHETAHAVACKKYGGTLREAGLLFILLVPIPYVDLTSTWRFSSKWHRIVTSAAGIYAELLIAALAMIVWSRTDASLVHQNAQNVIITAGFVTVMFNANPLMRFDGYYILSDWLEVPNLASHGQQYLSYLGTHYILGIPATKPQWPEGKSTWIAVYGVAACLWRIIVCVTLVIAAESLLLGAGVVLAVVAVALWVVLPGIKVLRSALFGSSTQPANPRYFTTVVLVASLVAALIWTCVPWYSRIRAPAIVDYLPITDVRTPVAGFVRHVFVEPGDHVQAGQVLVELENQELALEAQRLAIEFKQIGMRAREYRAAEQIAAWQIEAQNELALEDRLSQIEEQLAQLSIRAPVAGRVLSSDLSSQVGTFVASGATAIQLGGDGRKAILALVPQQEVDAIRDRTGGEVTVHFWGTGVRAKSRLVEFHPRATTSLSHPALGSAAGGPLQVVIRPPSFDPQQRKRTDSQWSLADPHFEAVVACDFDDSDDLTAGQTGYIEWRYRRGSLGAVVTNHVKEWLRRRRLAASDFAENAGYSVRPRGRMHIAGKLSLPACGFPRST